MRLAKGWGKFPPGGNLKEALRCLRNDDAEPKDKQSEDVTVTDNRCRDDTVQDEDSIDEPNGDDSVSAGEQACERSDDVGTVVVDFDGNPVPERLKVIFESMPMFRRAARDAERVANQFQEIEQTLVYRKATEGKKHREHSTYIRAAARAINSMTPKRPCPQCGGKDEPSLDNDPCPACLDRGYQTGEDLEP